MVDRGGRGSGKVSARDEAGSSDGLAIANRVEGVPALRAPWWVPLAFVVLTLLALLATPVLVERRVARIRNSLTNGSQRARVLINDLEASFAVQVLADASAEARGDSALFAARDSLRSDERQLP